jgi:hypothetical protein
MRQLSQYSDWLWGLTFRVTFSAEAKDFLFYWTGFEIHLSSYTMGMGALTTTRKMVEV